MLAGRQQEIHAERDRKLEEARKQRQISSVAGRVNKGPVSPFPVVADTSKHYAVTEEYQSGERDPRPFEPTV
jgi:hypothetical protein